MADETLVRAVLADWRTAPVAPHVRAALAFIEKLTLRPTEVSGTDVDALRAAGLSDAAIEDAIHVCALFNIYDRIADALDFHVPGPRGFASSAKRLLGRGYA